MFVGQGGGHELLGDKDGVFALGLNLGRICIISVDEKSSLF